eukprot:CAMPEP_0184971964 /NCGR_PEP_ID=MMETSP1098-20130426/4062_1 /TAXON_ID=89044 /ORGANISM="Spumella elongata, Strain CCAP 955/1" /LENGTH=275 /DNA_ID=CAMNT_0027494171 /DNA_START=21 /DNA_END=848 /DNA_ORIENTATION=-
MPKLSKRKRQLRNLFARNLGRSAAEGGAEDAEGSGQEDGEGEEESSDEEEPPKPTEVVKPAAGRSARLAQKNASSQSLAAANAAAASSSSAAPSSQQGKSGDAPPERVWVQCNTCDKWRSLPSTVDPDKLPDIWTCDLNIYDNTRNNCNAPEESYKLPQEEQHEQLKAFVKVWAKRLKCADRAETRLSNAALTRGKKRKVDAEWIKCSSPACGKWRAIPRTIETATLLKRLNKGRFFGGDGVWYCSMNSWDETTGSCAAPQEPLWNCRWNVNNNR